MIAYNRISKQLALALCFTLCVFLATAFCEEQWRTDFDETCAKTTNAMSLSVDELKFLISKCDQLQKVIEKQEESTRKVFLRRLQLCKNLYVFVLESKNNDTLPK